MIESIIVLATQATSIRIPTIYVDIVVFLRQIILIILAATVITATISILTFK